DLKTDRLISSLEVTCQNESCGKPFRIVGDWINPSYEMLIYDCYHLIQEKRYCYSILNLAQSFEVFFSTYLRVELLYKPFRREREAFHQDSNRDRSDPQIQFNALSNLLFDKTKLYSYSKMRNIFVNLILSRETIPNFETSEKIISKISSLAKSEVADEEIDRFDSNRIGGLLKRLREPNVIELRNKVVHKYAYRPTLKEVEDSLAETQDIVRPLGTLLLIYGDNIVQYLNSSLSI
ncbi:MAG TPA: hypothetical protein VKS81_11830, partial [Bacteroidota bacterium]|nr:hypothetical protein [Bacteroidota bacterium]